MSITKSVCTSLAIAMLAFSTASAQRTLDVNQAGAIAIDGVVSAGEWDAAAVGGNFGLLRGAAGADTEGSEVRLLWDNDAIYMLYTSTFGDWNGPAGAINFSADNLNIYFDPNNDNEPNTAGDQDSYQLAFAQPMGSADQSVTTPFFEARENGNFGNSANWAPTGITYAQVNGDSGGVAEVRIPWSDFSATGLENTSAPAVGDEWLFNVGRISSGPGGPLPIFNHHPGQFFAERPMAEITFVPEPAGSAAPFFAPLILGFAIRRRR